jgi:primosomal protein N' (replication factor Y)
MFITTSPYLYLMRRWLEKLRKNTKRNRDSQLEHRNGHSGRCSWKQKWLDSPWISSDILPKVFTLPSLIIVPLTLVPAPIYADCAIPSSTDRLFTYAVPEELRSSVQVAVRVLIPFGPRTVVGIVARLTSVPSTQHRLKSLLDVLDTEPVVPADLFELTRWIADYYVVPWADVLRTVIVQGATRPGERVVALIEGIDPAVVLKARRNAPTQSAIIESLLTQSDRTASISKLQKLIGSKNIAAALHQLAQQGLVAVREVQRRTSLRPKLETVIQIRQSDRTRWEEWLSENVRTQTQRQARFLQALSTVDESEVPLTDFLKRTTLSRSTLRALQGKGLVTVAQREVVRAPEYDVHPGSLGAQNVTLTGNQQQALSAIGDGLQSRSFHAYLLHGVTGSGKTEVYIRAIRIALSKAKSAIVLVPEIALTPQIVRRFKHHFGEKVAVLHSRMSAGERVDAWRLARAGERSIMIGPRSAIFAPLPDVGLIIVDEEHEPSYKQFDQSPRYHARDVAVMRARLAGAVVVLGSATPSLESYFNALNTKYTLLRLPERVDNAQLPDIAIVDMTAERQRKLDVYRAERKAEFAADAVAARASSRRFESQSLSELLRAKIEDRLTKGEGIILLQNRRGFSPFVECPDCGFVPTCSNCNISLTFHRTRRQLRCHYCGSVETAPSACPRCSSASIEYRGFGTQRVEEELARDFPRARIVRMDLDTTTTRGAHDMLLRKFSDGEADILLGTQMVAKGLDFSRVTLVGVVSADTQMLLPDFRSAERTFQLLTQVAGRAGRSKLLGEVIIQTFQPNHPTLKHVVLHDFEAFFSEELAHRKELHYPPASRMVLVEFKGRAEREVRQYAERFAQLLRPSAPRSFILLGPASAALAKLRGVYRWHIVLKSVPRDPSGELLRRTLREALSHFSGTPEGKSRSVRLTVDVDPHGMM